MDWLLERIGAAAEKAALRCDIGLYDYSRYPGNEPPHVVIDEGTGARILRTWDPAAARREYQRQTRMRIGAAIVKAIQESVLLPAAQQEPRDEG